MIGLIGAGAIGSVHALAYRANGTPVSAVMSRSLDHARRVAALCDAPVATDQLDHLLALAEVKAVDICTPTDSHAALTVAAARAGKHVHVEKPISLSLTDADQMEAACLKAGVSLMVGQTARFQAPSIAVRRALDDGVVGRPQHVEIRWNHGTFWPGGWRGWQIDPARSGGHLVHNGVHAFDLACWLMADRPVRVYAQSRFVAHPEMRSPDYWHAQVLFADGGSALCEIGYILQETQAVRRTLTVYGRFGTIRHDSADDGAIVGRTGPLTSGPEPIARQLGDWVRALESDSPVPVAGWEGRRALAVALAADASARTGRPQTVDV